MRLILTKKNIVSLNQYKHILIINKKGIEGIYKSNELKDLRSVIMTLKIKYNEYLLLNNEVYK